MDGLVGSYVCSAYIGTAGENDYHHVKVVPTADDITSDGLSTFQWINRAGVSWSLTFRRPDDSLLSVGTDCPYYSDGYVQCKVIWASDGCGRAVALFGPFNERYDRCEESPRLEERPPLMLPAAVALPEVLVEEKESRRHAFIMPVSSTGASWGDLAYLAAIPASANLNRGRPTVLVPNDVSDKDDDALVDFLDRYKPTDMAVFHSNQLQIDLAEPRNIDSAPRVRHHHQVWDDLNTVTISLARAAWPSASATRIVAAQAKDYAGALLSSSLAARLEAPLLYVGSDGWNDNVLHVICEFRPLEILFVGEGMDDSSISDYMRELLENNDNVFPRAVPIGGVADAITWLVSQGLNVDYLALVNPADRTASERCVSRKISLTGPVYAAHRNGLVVSVSNIPISLNGENQCPEALRRSLEALFSAIKACPRPPEHIALVGGFDVVPTCQTKSDCNNSKIFAVTDIPYSQFGGHHTTCKQFRDAAIGRIYAESLSCGSLLAARTVNYELVFDGNWDSTIVESGTWGFPELTRLFQIAGVDNAPKHLLESNISKVRILEAAAILHKDHSSAVGLGNFVSTKTSALFAPAVVITRGCHAAGIDEGNQWHGTVAGMMLGRGCVCYVGSPRSPTTSNTLTEVAYFHELLYAGERDMSVGRAMRLAFNKALVHHLDGGHMDPYCLENEILLGDPALVPCFANAGITNHATSTMRDNVIAPASTSLDEGGIVTVVGPSEWLLTPIHRDQLKEWKYEGNLFTFVAPRVEQETIWCGKGYDQQELYYIVSVDLPPGVTVSEVTALDAIENLGGTTTVHAAGSGWTKRWWPSGRHYPHRQWDGSVTVRWRLRLLDYDMETGLIKAQLKSARFRLDLK